MMRKDESLPPAMELGFFLNVDEFEFLKGDRVKTDRNIFSRS